MCVKKPIPLKIIEDFPTLPHSGQTKIRKNAVKSNTKSKKNTYEKPASPAEPISIGDHSNGSGSCSIMESEPLDLTAKSDVGSSS